MKKYQTHNDKEIDTNGSSLCGHIEVSYNRLIELFGEPTEGDEYKVDAEWHVNFDNGIVSTIYNYKNGKNYLGNRGENVENITHWHVGGYEMNSLKLIKELI